MSANYQSQTAPDHREREALHRYAVIRELSDENLTPRQRGALVRAAVDHLHPDPTGGLRSHSRSSIDRWIRAWHLGGFEALKPAQRKRGPLTDPEILSAACDLRREQPERTGAQIATILAALHGEAAPSERTVQRHLAARGLRRFELGPGAAIGRFEADRPNQLWVADCLHGPKPEFRS